jgi:DNA-binding CsgD family transcriptional regulator
MLTPAMQRYLYWWGQGLDRQAIADKYGVSRGVVHCLLWQARKCLGADTLEEAWDTAKSEIEENLAWLLQLTRKRKHQAKPTKEGSLTKTQIALLTHMAAGDAVTDAAEQLGMSPNTAYVHLKNARDRLGAPSNQGLLQKAVDLGYIS